MELGNILYQLTFGLVTKLVNLCDTLYKFLFSSFKIGDLNIQMWALLSGSLITTLIIMFLVKRLVPFI